MSFERKCKKMNKDTILKIVGVGCGILIEYLDCILCFLHDFEEIDKWENKNEILFKMRFADDDAVFCAGCGTRVSDNKTNQNVENLQPTAEPEKVVQPTVEQTVNKEKPNVTIPFRFSNKVCMHRV